jgi:hypothetical protein
MKMRVAFIAGCCGCWCCLLLVLPQGFIHLSRVITTSSSVTIPEAWDYRRFAANHSDLLRKVIEISSQTRSGEMN